MTTEQETHTKQNMSHFLAGVEKRAFRMAMIATKHNEDALDIVQESMMKMVKYYSLKPESQWKPLFYKILHNNIMDWHRQQKWHRLFAFTHEGTENSMADTQWQPDESINPESMAINKDLSARAIHVLLELPVKQKQCFLLRAWEGLSVKETAQIMKCTEGSVKTHFYRASQKLKSVLESSYDN